MERWLSLGCGGKGQTIWEVGDRGAARGRGPRRKSVKCQCIRVLSGFLCPPLKCGLNEEEGKGIWLSWVGGTCRDALWSGSMSGLINRCGKDYERPSPPWTPAPQGLGRRVSIVKVKSGSFVRLCGVVGTPAQYSFL